MRIRLKVLSLKDKVEVAETFTVRSYLMVGVERTFQLIL